MRPMKNITLAFLFVALIIFPLRTTCADSSAIVGTQAPDFQLQDASGAEISLSQFRGKPVVLEWFNARCPFVQKFYRGGDMPHFQKQATENGAIWLTINSSSQGKLGHLTPEHALEITKSLRMNSTALLLDPTSTVARLYGARITPHLLVIDAVGILAYQGAIDNVPSTDSSDIAGATNYVLAALAALAANKPVQPSSTEPYGCSVKY